LGPHWRIAIAALTTGISMLVPSPALALRPGDLLVVDQNNLRVLRVQPSTGAVTVLSPPPGSRPEENLLTSPRGIGTHPRGAIVVVNYFEATLVSIDPATGQQFLLSDLGGTPAVGSLPRDVTPNPREPAPGFFPTLYVSSRGELHRVLWGPVSSEGALVDPYPPPFDPLTASFVVAAEPTLDGPLDFVIATDAIPAVLLYQGSNGAIAPIWQPGGEAITGLAIENASTFFAAWRAGTCPDPASGIYRTQSRGALSPFYQGGDLGCPGPIALDDLGRLYAVGLGGANPRVLRLQEMGPSVTIEQVAELPSAASPSDMVVYSPEPDSATGGLAAALACGGLRRLRRQGRIRS
jgi:hypothetical protein